MRGIGTVINMAAILAGGSVGLILKKRLEKNIGQGIQQAMGVAAFFIGVSGVLEGMFTVSRNSIEVKGSYILIVSLALGAFVGGEFNIEQKIESFGCLLKKKFRCEKDDKFIEGFVNTSLAVCIGAMAILGPLEEGLKGSSLILYEKASFDAVCLLVFAAAYGKGALFAAIPVGIWQGSLTLLAAAWAPMFSDKIVEDMALVGNTLIFCLGINLIFGKKIKTGNLLPSIIIAAFCHCMAG